MPTSAYEAHLAICRPCRAGLAEISAIPSLLAGLDESVFADRHRRAVGQRPETGGQRGIFTSGTALTETQIKNLQITQPNGPAILALGCPASSGLRIASRPGPAAWPRRMRTCVRGGTRRAR